MEKIILVGAGGHAKSIIESISSSNCFDIIGILDVKDKIGTDVNNVKVIGTDSDLVDYFNKGVRYAFISVGSIGNPYIRVRLYRYIKKIGYELPNIIDKSAVLSENIMYGEGSFIGKGAIVNANVLIGNNCIINTGCIVEHDCIIEDFVHLAPGSVLCGGVKIGRETHIGANSTIIQCKTIGYNSIIGAGSVVTNDIGNHKKAYGNPCREVNEIE